MWIPKGTTLIRGRRLFKCGYPKLRRLFEGDAYFNVDTQRYDAYYRATLISMCISKATTLIRGRRLFQCGYPKVRRILEGGAYFNADTQRYDVY